MNINITKCYAMLIYGPCTASLLSRAVVKVDVPHAS